jgi:hypothetical protein
MYTPMKRRIFTKILGISALYFGIFMLLAFIQFGGENGFNKHIGALRIHGSFKSRTEAGELSKTAGEQAYFVEDNTKVFFAGLEFQLYGKKENGLQYVDKDGVRVAAYPESMTLSKNEARFHLSGGQELSFYANSENEGKELTISALLTDDVERILLPFEVSGKASTGVNELGRLTVSYGGEEYTFETTHINEERSQIFLSRADPIVFYRVIPSDNIFNLAGFIVSGGMEKTLYNGITQQWRDAVFVDWERRITSANSDPAGVNEAVITAYLAEAAQRGTLVHAINMLPAAFRRGGAQTFLSVPFLGNLNASLRGFVASESERMARIASYAADKPSSFLTEKRIFEYLAIRGNDELFNSGIEYINHLNPASLTLDMCAGIFEGWQSWNKWRSGPNPFDTFLPKASALVSAYIKKDKSTSNVFVMDDTVDVLYNIRLGIALTLYGDAVMSGGWSAIGRSIIISALSFAREDASISSELEMSAAGLFTPVASGGVLTPVRLYQELELSEFYPHSVGSGKTAGGVWLWTVSPDVDISFQNNVLDIYVNFPIGETHYIYILNVPAFSRIQMRNMDYRSDPRFEQYNAPGWLYSAAERVMMVKIVQASVSEPIRIIF